MVPPHRLAFLFRFCAPTLTNDQKAAAFRCEISNIPNSTFPISTNDTPNFPLAGLISQLVCIPILVSPIPKFPILQFSNFGRSNFQSFLVRPSFQVPIFFTFPFCCKPPISKSCYCQMFPIFQVSNVLIFNISNCCKPNFQKLLGIGNLGLQKFKLDLPISKFEKMGSPKLVNWFA